MNKIKRPEIAALAVQAAAMVGLPGLTLLLGTLDTYFVAFMLILLVIHPMCCLGIGIFSGMNSKARWWLVLTGSLLALCGEWIFLAFEMTFLIYSGIDLLLGIVGMGSTALVRRVILKKRESPAK